jgi:cation diffusion facilitator family transporter
MMAETLHSFSDCINQLLLLLGVKKAAQPADEHFPLGYGRSLYFWSFMVALLLFSGGGVFSIYEGIHKIVHPEPLAGGLTLSLFILIASLVLEGKAPWDNLKEIKRRRGDQGLLTYLQNTKDSDLVVIFGENAAATLGLAIAALALGMTKVTGNPQWDGVGSLGVGLILVGVAIFLAKEIKSLLLGEAADPQLNKSVYQLGNHHPEIIRIHTIIALQQGPGEVLLACKVECKEDLPFKEVARVINEIEDQIRATHPEMKWIFMEPETSKV